MVKSSLSWMKYLGIPVLSVSRGKAAGQSAALAKSFGEDPTEWCWLWLWISGTRNRSDYISSGFYYIARDANVPIVFGTLDYRTKRMICSKAFDPTTMTKEEILKEAINFSEEWDLKGAGYIPENASTLAFKPSKKD